jgi:hypothetical protein
MNFSRYILAYACIAVIVGNVFAAPSSEDPEIKKLKQAVKEIEDSIGILKEEDETIKSKVIDVEKQTNGTLEEQKVKIDSVNTIATENSEKLGQLPQLSEKINEVEQQVKATDGSAQIEQLKHGMETLDSKIQELSSKKDSSADLEAMKSTITELNKKLDEQETLNRKQSLDMAENKTRLDRIEERRQAEFYSNLGSVAGGLLGAAIQGGVQGGLSLLTSKLLNPEYIREQVANGAPVSANIPNLTNEEKNGIKAVEDDIKNGKSDVEIQGKLELIGKKIEKRETSKRKFQQITFYGINEVFKDKTIIYTIIQQTRFGRKIVPENIIPGGKPNEADVDLVNTICNMTNNGATIGDVLDNIKLIFSGSPMKIIKNQSDEMIDGSQQSTPKDQPLPMGGRLDQSSPKSDNLRTPEIVQSNAIGTADQSSLPVASNDGGTQPVTSTNVQLQDGAQQNTASGQQGSGKTVQSSALQSEAQAQQTQSSASENQVIIPSQNTSKLLDNGQNTQSEDSSVNQVPHPTDGQVTTASQTQQTASQRVDAGGDTEKQDVNSQLESSSTQQQNTGNSTLTESNATQTAPGGAAVQSIIPGSTTVETMQITATNSKKSSNDGLVSRAPSDEQVPIQQESTAIAQTQQKSPLNSSPSVNATNTELNQGEMHEQNSAIVTQPPLVANPSLQVPELPNGDRRSATQGGEKMAPTQQSNIGNSQRQVLVGEKSAIAPGQNFVTAVQQAIKPGQTQQADISNTQATQQQQSTSGTQNNISTVSQSSHVEQNGQQQQNPLMQSSGGVEKSNSEQSGNEQQITVTQQDKKPDQRVGQGSTSSNNGLPSLESSGSAQQINSVQQEGTQQTTIQGAKIGNGNIEQQNKIPQINATQQKAQTQSSGNLNQQATQLDTAHSNGQSGQAQLNSGQQVVATQQVGNSNQKASAEGNATSNDKSAGQNQNTQSAGNQQVAQGVGNPPQSGALSTMTIMDIVDNKYYDVDRNNFMKIARSSTKFPKVDNINALSVTPIDQASEKRLDAFKR